MYVPQEGLHNVTVQPLNSAEDDYPPFQLTFEMVGQVVGLTIDDKNEVTVKEEDKWFYFAFESLGGGTCVHVDWADGTEETFGDDTFCAAWKPDVPYRVGVTMLDPIEITHSYAVFGIYNVSATAHNLVTEVPTSDDLTIIVTNGVCR